MKARGFHFRPCKGCRHQESILCFNLVGRYYRKKWMNVSGDSSVFIVNAFSKFTHLQLNSKGNSVKRYTLSFKASELKRNQSLY